MTRTSSSSPACSILSSAAASGRSFTSRTSGRRITARRTARFCMKTRTTAHFPKAGEISSSHAICAFSRARSAFPARATCWNFTAAKPASRSRGVGGCGSHILWNISVENQKRERRMRFNSADRRCALKKCSAARFRVARCITASRGAAPR